MNGLMNKQTETQHTITRDSRQDKKQANKNKNIKLD